MGAKKKPTDGQRMAKNIAKLKKARETMARHNVDVDAFLSDDPVRVHQLHKATMAIDDMATLNRHRRLPSSSTAPTPERTAHANAPPREIGDNPAASKSHRFEWCIDTINDKLAQRQYGAAERFREKYFQAEPSSGVADTTGAGGASDPSKRLAITEAAELAAREVRWIADRLDGETKEIVNAFVLELAPPHTEKPLAIGDWSARRMKLGRDRAIGADIGLIRAACERLASLGAAYHAWQKEQCRRTDRMMRSPIGQRAGRQGWICSLWDWCHRNGRLPQLQGDLDAVRARHDAEAHRLRSAPPMQLERFHRRRDRLTSIAFRETDERMRATG
jgi:hypothetical protein